MISDQDAGVIIVDCIIHQDNPNAIGFTFECAEKGKKPTPQQIIDALSEYLLYIDPDTFAPKNTRMKEAH